MSAKEDWYDPHGCQDHSSAEAYITTLEKELALKQSFYELAIKERDYERAQVDRLKSNALTVAICDLPEKDREHEELKQKSDAANALIKTMRDIDEKGVAFGESVLATSVKCAELQKAIIDAYKIGCESPELNMNNYDEHDVSILNDAMTDVCGILAEHIKS